MTFWEHNTKNNLKIHKRRELFKQTESLKVYLGMINYRTVQHNFLYRRIFECAYIDWVRSMIYIHLLFCWEENMKICVPYAVVCMRLTALIDRRVEELLQHSQVISGYNREQVRFNWSWMEPTAVSCHPRNNS